MPAEVVPARAEALPALAAVAARAFHDELPYSALFPDEPSRAQKLLAWFRLALPGAMSAGFLVETTRAQLGMAMWSPPKHQDSSMGGGGQQRCRTPSGPAAAR